MEYFYSMNAKTETAILLGYYKRITMKNILRQVAGALLVSGALAVSAGANAQQIATIGTGTSTFSTYNPISVGGFGFFGPPVRGTHMQIMYTAAQINAGGVTGAGMLDSIAWQVAQVPGVNLKDYTIKMVSTPLSSLDDFITSGLTTAVSMPTYMPADTGWQWIGFSTPFFWNGVDNIVFDICSDTTTANPSGKVNTYFGTGPEMYWVSNTSPDPLCGVYTNGYASEQQANIKLSFSAAPACTGTPVTGIISPGDDTLTVCAGLSQLILLTNPPQNNVTYQWQVSADGGAWQDVANANGTGYLAVASMANQFATYRVKITCAASSLFSTSNTFTVETSAGASYAALPYHQDFESWTSRCSVNEIPDSNWTANPVTGDGSWRREDQGADADWQYDVAPYYYNPVSSEGSHSARFHSSAGVQGSLSLSLDCSSPGEKELRFDYFNKTGGTLATLSIVLSKDGGATFPDTLATLSPQGVQSASWQPQVVPFSSDSANTVIMFYATGVSQSGDFDMGIDNLTVLAPCDGTPVAGEVDSTAACQGSGVSLALSGNTSAAGLKYLWQETTDGVNWNTVDTIENPSTPLNEDAWFRCIVTCSNTNLSDTTAPKLIKVNPVYHCYCNSASTVPSTDINIGNVVLANSDFSDTLLNNGNPLPATANLAANQHYTDYTSVAPANLFVDSTYQLLLTYMTANGTNVWPQMGTAYVHVYIDYNHDGVFDENSELAWHYYKQADTFTTLGSFTVPDSALYGITGMRIVTDNTWDSTAVSACGSFSYGETEDYLVKINGEPCTGPVNAGMISVSDSISCPGYPLSLSSSGYETQTAPFSKVWQSSPDQTTWTDVAGTEGVDNLEQTITANTWYRIKATCLNTSDLSFSDTVKVALNPLCYCVSYADGGFSGLADSSDVGSFKLANVQIPLTGGHLNNAAATSLYTNYGLQDTVVMYADSVYNFTLDHILRGNTHADAKVTIFIDFNGNGSFDLPSEKVYSGMTTATGWHISGNITIPDNVVLDQPVGLRIILDNDTTASTASEDGCGSYVSGETEDYVALFKQKPNGIGSHFVSVGSISIFPNPATGKVLVRYNGVAHKDASVKVINVVGQTVINQAMNGLQNGQIISLDLNNFARGVYLIQLDADGGRTVGKVVLQ